MITKNDNSDNIMTMLTKIDLTVKTKIDNNENKCDNTMIIMIKEMPMIKKMITEMIPMIKKMITMITIDDDPTDLSIYRTTPSKTSSVIQPHPSSLKNNPL